MSAVALRSAPFRSGGDRGASLVLVALLLSAIFIVAALAVDFSVVRHDRQANKSATDQSVVAGVRELDDSGMVRPWRGICAARDFLLANDDELVGMAVTYTDGRGDPVTDTDGNVVTDPCASPPPQICLDDDPSTWGILTGRSADGRVRATVRSAYPMPDPDFAEDAEEDASDFGASTPCENLAVILEERETALFGQVTGAPSYDTTIRSVARLDWEYPSDVAPALLLLERAKCKALHVGGSSGAVVTAEGQESTPGVMHADSLGSDGATCNPGNPEEGNIFQVDSNPSSPLIVAAASGDGTVPGELTAVALTGARSAEPRVASSPTPREVCAELSVGGCEGTPPVSGPLLGRDLVGRGGVDARYLVAVRAAASKYSYTTRPTGFVEMPCAADPAGYPGPNLWVNCAGGEFDGANKTFGPTVQRVVINGYVTVGGKDSTLQFTDVDELYIRGRSGGPGVSVAGAAGNTLAVKTGADPKAMCPGGARPDRATMVIGNGPFEVTGGNDASNPKVLRLCNSTVVLADNTGASCAIPATSGLPPNDGNTCIGRIRVAGQAAVDWTAPDTTVGEPTAADHQRFEDLAFWSETRGAGVEWGITGNGKVTLAGVFFTPNADPIRIGGNGDYDILDAQFVTRRLEVAGNAALTMKPDPRNAITIPWIGNFRLVR